MTDNHLIFSRSQAPPVVGELRIRMNEHGIGVSEIYTGESWVEMTAPSYEALLAENQRLRKENEQLKAENERLFTSMLDMALDEEVRRLKGK